MPRLLTPEEAENEALAIAQEDVRRFRDRFCSELNLDRFFHELAQHCGVPNDFTFQAELVRACYPTSGLGLSAYYLHPEDLKPVERIVRIVRQEIVAIGVLRQRYRELKAGQGSNVAQISLELDREARQHRQNLSKLFASLKAHIGALPGTNVAEVFDRVEEARVHLGTSSSTSRYEEAARDLDDLLEKWSTATGSKQGKRASVQELDGLIERLARLYEKTVGRPKADKPFRAFVEFVVDQLPQTGIRVTNSGDQVRLKKRIQEVLRHR